MKIRCELPCVFNISGRCADEADFFNSKCRNFRKKAMPVRLARLTELVEQLLDPLECYSDNICIKLEQPARKSLFKKSFSQFSDRRNPITLGDLRQAVKEGKEE